MISKPPSLGALILAGGASRRASGQPKALRMRDGLPQVVRLCRALQRAGATPAWVVGGAHHPEISRVLAGETAVVCLQAVDWANGVSASLKAGIRHVTTLDPGPDALLVTPVDLFEAGDEAWAALVAEWREAPGVLATATIPEGLAGAPAIFPRSEWAALLATEGDVGARDWLRAEGSRVRLFRHPLLTRDHDGPAQ